MLHKLFPSLFLLIPPNSSSLCPLEPNMLVVQKTGVEVAISFTSHSRETEEANEETRPFSFLLTSQNYFQPYFSWFHQVSLHCRLVNSKNKLGNSNLLARNGQETEEANCRQILTPFYTYYYFPFCFLLIPPTTLLHYHPRPDNQFENERGSSNLHNKTRFQ